MASWTLLNPPAWRSKDNTRPGVVAPPTTTSEQQLETPPVLTPGQIQQKLQDQPPLFLLISRANPVTMQLVNAVTNEVMYKICETGRGKFSNKPDYEICRMSGDDSLIVGSIRFGRRGVEMRLPMVGRTMDDIREVESQTGTKLRWTIGHIGRHKPSDQKSEEESKNAARWIAALDCHDKALDTGDGSSQALVCAVRLYDTLPNGRFEVWDRNACVDIGGDWNLLDELVTISFANMEVSRRKLMAGPDPTFSGLQGLGMAVAANGIAS